MRLLKNVENWKVKCVNQNKRLKSNITSIKRGNQKPMTFEEIDSLQNFDKKECNSMCIR